MTSRGTSDFWRHYAELPLEVREAARSAYRKFSHDPTHPGLQLQRLRKDPRFWAVRITRDHRAVARRYENDVWVWVWIGSHRAFDREFSG